MQGTRLLRASQLLLVVSVCVALGMFALRSLKRESPDDSVAPTRAEQLFARWAADYAENEMYTRTPIRLAFSRALSKRFTRAAGNVEINFETGKVTVATEDLEAIPEDSVYEVWLVDDIPGVHNSAALDLGEGGDTILSLGALPASGSLTTFVDLNELASLYVDFNKPVILVLFAGGGIVLKSWTVPWRPAMADRELYVQAAWAYSRTGAFSLAVASKITLPSGLPPTTSPQFSSIYTQDPAGAYGDFSPGLDSRFLPITRYTVK